MSHHFTFQVKSLGFSYAYKNQPVLRDYVRQLMALPNLPGEHIADTFDWLRGRCPVIEENAEGLQKLLRYMSRNWVHNDHVTPASWSNYRREVRTNNDVEGWHQRLNGSAPIAHPNMYFLLWLLHAETDSLRIQVRQIAQQQVLRRTRKEFIEKNARLNALWDEYDDKTKTTSAFLRDCGAIADHCERD